MYIDIPSTLFVTASLLTVNLKRLSIEMIPVAITSSTQMRIVSRSVGSMDASSSAVAGALEGREDREEGRLLGFFAESFLWYLSMRPHTYINA